MKITIGIPVYNEEKYIQKTVESILNQTYSDLEILIVNDGSTDNTFKVLKKLILQDPRIIVITQENKGISKTRNVILENASGDYITFIDADDEVDNDLIENYLKIVREFSPDIICTNYFEYQFGNKESRIIKNNLPYNKILKKNEIIEFFIKPYFQKEIGIISSVCTKAYSKEFLLKNNLFFEEDLKRGEDYWFNFYAFQKAETVYAIDKAFYHYYTQPGSIMRTYFEDQYENIFINRKRLKKVESDFSLQVSWEEKNTQAINRISEIFLMEIKNKGFKNSYSNIIKQLKNPEIQNFFRTGKVSKVHLKIIRFLILIKQNFFAVLIYYVWSFRMRKE